MRIWRDVAGAADPFTTSPKKWDQFETLNVSCRRASIPWLRTTTTLVDLSHAR